MSWALAQIIGKREEGGLVSPPAACGGRGGARHGRSAILGSAASAFPQGPPTSGSGRSGSRRAAAVSIRGQQPYYGEKPMVNSKEKTEGQAEGEETAQGEAHFFEIKDV